MKFVYKTIFTLLIISLLINSGTASSYAYDYKFMKLDGSKSDISEFEGKPLLVDTMATWCEPCKIEFVHLYEVNKAMNGKINILSISVDLSDDLTKIKNFKAGVEADNNILLTWTFASDYQEEFLNGFNITNIPTLILLDQDGNIQKTWVGLVDTQDILNEIDSSITIDSGSDNILLNFLVDNVAFQFTIGFSAILIIYLKLVPKPEKELIENE